METMTEAAHHDAPWGNFLAQVFRDGGWTVRTKPNRGGLVIARRRKKYVADLKFSAEGRRDRLIPLLSQAILQAQALANRSAAPLDPLAVVGAERISPAVAEDVRRFAQEYEPGVAVGIIDLEGFRSFSGPGLDGLDASASLSRKS